MAAETGGFSVRKELLCLIFRQYRIGMLFIP